MNSYVIPYHPTLLKVKVTADFEIPSSNKHDISSGGLAGIVLGTLAFAATLSAAVSLLIYRRCISKRHGGPKRRQGKHFLPLKISF